MVIWICMCVLFMFFNVWLFCTLLLLVLSPLPSFPFSRVSRKLWGWIRARQRHQPSKRYKGLSNSACKGSQQERYRAETKATRTSWLRVCACVRSSLKISFRLVYEYAAPLSLSLNNVYYRIPTLPTLPTLNWNWFGNMKCKTQRFHQ